MSSLCTLQLLEPWSDSPCSFGEQFGWTDETKQAMWLAKGSSCQGIYSCCAQRVACTRPTRWSNATCKCADGDPEHTRKLWHRDETRWFSAHRDYTYRLVVAAMFKNEADILSEWMEHHMWQGVEHFYLITNNSTDRWAEALLPFAAYVTLFSAPKSHRKVQLLDQLILPLVRQQSRWVLHIDIDEFVYGRPAKGVRNLFDFVLRLEAERPHAEAVLLHWRTFSSSGRVTQSSQGVRTGFTAAASSLGNCTKWLARTAALEGFGVHWPTLVACKLHYGGAWNRARCPAAAGASSRLVDGRLAELWPERVSPEAYCGAFPMELVRAPSAIETLLVQINHYQTMSWQRFNDKKRHRGVAATLSYGAKRDALSDQLQASGEYWERYERFASDAVATELKELVERHRADRAVINRVL